MDGPPRTAYSAIDSPGGPDAQCHGQSGGTTYSMTDPLNTRNGGGPKFHRGTNFFVKKTGLGGPKLLVKMVPRTDFR